MPFFSALKSDRMTRRGVRPNFFARSSKMP
jgi:hypothetical protein